MTAENRRYARRAGARVERASMRPRPMTAENSRGSRRLRRGRRCFNEAAADDRGKRLEHRGAFSSGFCFNEAAADDRGKRRRASRESARSARGFNEAAADDRGKLGGRRLGAPRRAASMRPRPMTAENARRRPPGTRRRRRFNEAAADDRGKRLRPARSRRARASFNEAAADDRGKPTTVKPCQGHRGELQ